MRQATSHFQPYRSLNRIYKLVGNRKETSQLQDFEEYSYYSEEAIARINKVTEEIWSPDNFEPDWLRAPKEEDCFRRNLKPLC